MNHRAAIFVLAVALAEYRAYPESTSAARGVGAWAMKTCAPSNVSAVAVDVVLLTITTIAATYFHTLVVK